MSHKVLLIGGGAREHAMARALCESGASLYSVMNNRNPGILKLARETLHIPETAGELIVNFARANGVELALCGPEGPLEAGVTDALEKSGIPCAAPSKAAARIETSKEFMRGLMARHNLPGRLEHWVFTTTEQVNDFIRTHDGGVAVKPVGLTGGKGVRISGDQLQSQDDVVAYAREVLETKTGKQQMVIIEEKAEGEEFTLQCFSDGKHILPMPAVQDHKRAFENDEGPNTGGMGSYTQEDHLLPFLEKDHYDAGVKIVQSVIDALALEGCPFRGPIYGQFMLTKNGPKVIEFNARFGDPEAMNVLSLFEGDFLALAGAMARGNISSAKVSFARKATVCKYVVPVGYGVASRSGEVICVDEPGAEREGARIYYAAVDAAGDGKVTTTKSRSIGVVGIAGTIGDAEQSCERALGHIGGHYFVRHDIGRAAALKKKTDHMNELRRI